MFTNIGKKIKILAIVVCILFAVASLISGILIMYEADEAVGIVVILGGFIMSWISSWFVYGFGELIDKACEIERNTRPPFNRQGANPYNQARPNQGGFAPNAGFAQNAAPGANPYAQPAPQAAPRAQAQSQEANNRFVRLETLRRAGVITEEEYQNAISRGGM